MLRSALLRESASERACVRVCASACACARARARVRVRVRVRVHALGCASGTHWRERGLNRRDAVGVTCIVC